MSSFRRMVRYDVRSQICETALLQKLWCNKMKIVICVNLNILYTLVKQSSWSGCGPSIRESHSGDNISLRASFRTAIFLVRSFCCDFAIRMSYITDNSPFLQFSHHYPLLFFLSYTFVVVSLSLWSTINNLSFWRKECIEFCITYVPFDISQQSYASIGKHCCIMFRCGLEQSLAVSCLPGRPELCV